MQAAFADARDDADIGVVILTGAGQARRSAPAATSASAARAATSATTACRGSTCSTCSARSARCRSRSSRWSPATRSAAATCCTWCATSPSPPTTRASARPARASAASTAATAPRTWRASSGRRRRARSGSSAASTTPQQALEMGLVNCVVPLDRLEDETVQWCREMLRQQPDRAALPQGGAQRRLRRPGRAAGTRRQRDAALLHVRGRPGRQERVPREAQARLPQVPALPLTPPAERPPAADPPTLPAAHERRAFDLRRRA